MVTQPVSVLVLTWSFLRFTRSQPPPPPPPPPVLNCIILYNSCAASARVGMSNALDVGLKPWDMIIISISAPLYLTLTISMRLQTGNARPWYLGSTVGYDSKLYEWRTSWSCVQALFIHYKQVLLFTALYMNTICIFRVRTLHTDFRPRCVFAYRCLPH